MKVFYRMLKITGIFLKPSLAKRLKSKNAAKQKKEDLNKAIKLALKLQNEVF